MIKIIGIDEAGRGPVIGSLMIGISIFNLEEKENIKNLNEKLKSLGFKDSKLILENKRNELFNYVVENFEYDFIELTPKKIDEVLNSFNSNLNKIELESIVKIIEKHKPNLVIIDSLTSNPKDFEKKIKEKINFNFEMICENKADLNFPIVSVASIIAKFKREENIKNLKEEFKIDFGSGYPSDPKTKIFLKENYKNKELEKIFRKSWNTYKKLTKKTLMDF